VRESGALRTSPRGSNTFSAALVGVICLVAQLVVGHLFESVQIAMLDLINVEAAQLAAQLFGPNCRSELVFLLGHLTENAQLPMCFSMVSSDLNSSFDCNRSGGHGPYHSLSGAPRVNTLPTRRWVCTLLPDTRRTGSFLGLDAVIWPAPSRSVSMLSPRAALAPWELVDHVGNGSSGARRFTTGRIQYRKQYRNLDLFSVRT
jgi:hypothetical protein